MRRAEAEQPVPTWLRGMAHVAMARARDEESAIAAGGGGALSPASERDDDAAAAASSSSAEAASAERGEKYGAQDFRSQAAAGSWGSAV